LFQDSFPVNFNAGALATVHPCLPVKINRVHIVNSDRLHILKFKKRFRNFRTMSGHYLPHSIRMADGATPRIETASRKAVAGILHDYGGDGDAPMSEHAKVGAVKKVGYDVAQVAEVMELAGESLKETLRLSNAIQQKSQEASQAIRSLKLGRWLRLGREILALQTKACCLFRRGCELSARAETNLGVAGALLAEVERKPEP
jgi:hypothetical protein